ncbi:MAG: Sua5/YciO/YrdC/YwlC family protein [Saprospiraceae bacterium]|nr:Sua5/YciO/YrdC/YwlC family protein [Saprospiraceae bacterium]MCF8249509.1 Sua5/YciO/YrdC/YwlC family protein [Saprospiraceae bacterium]MCF8280134.1 Sua5/YciO/YrdC/YwlC family protein [Bacteroidales bacterium]MCF8310727.1 Sua5/YciO/YrdC/YwlC family protein [Saprospiraceae bacterium]MCF8439442.1 Sua5/YciO/YrdC/YwlC family protein [Saprospiraceae bacterium]
MLTFTNQGTYMVQNYLLEPIVNTLQNGGLILFPTDTIWGIGCDATNPRAVARLRQLRELPPEQPLTLLAASIEQLKNHVAFIHPRVETLLQFHTRPLTIVYDQALNLPEHAAAADGSIAFRIPKDNFCLELLEELGKPIVATAACIGTAPHPGHFGEISSAVIEGIDLVVKYRQMDKDMSEPSVIARIGEGEELVFIRE